MRPTRMRVTSAQNDAPDVVAVVRHSSLFRVDLNDSQPTDGIEDVRL